MEEEKNNSFPEVLNVDECARYIRLSESMLWKLVREKKIPYIKIEGRYIFFLPAIKEWLKNNVIMPAEKENNEKQKAKETAAKIWNNVKGA